MEKDWSEDDINDVANEVADAIINNADGSAFVCFAIAVAVLMHIARDAKIPDSRAVDLLAATFADNPARFH